jgi:hypothetical protein
VRLSLLATAVATATVTVQVRTVLRRPGITSRQRAADRGWKLTTSGSLEIGPSLVFVC